MSAITPTADISAKKAGGASLGNPRNIAQAGELGRNIQAATADTFVQNIMPIIGAIRSSGASTLEAITQALNQRGIQAPRGGQWRASSVAYVLARSQRDSSALL